MFFSGYAFAGGAHTLSSSIVGSGTAWRVCASGCVIDELYGTTDISSARSTSFPEGWDENTILHARYNNTIAAGNVEFYSSLVTTVRVKRREVGSSEWVTIHEKIVDQNGNPATQLSFDYYDYLARGGVEYEYAFVPVLSGAEGDYYTARVKSEFNGVYIVGYNAQFHSDIDIESSNRRNRPVSIVQTINRKYPFVIHNGQSNYESGSVSAMFAEFDPATCSFKIDTAREYRKRLNDFLYDGRAKVLKFWDGRMWLVDISSAEITEMTNGHRQLVHSSFDWTEIGDADSESDLYLAGLSNYRGGE